ncbi:MAG: BsuPI-related putative proteinase inhibitor [Candidatus Bathyarchaeota archaeon]|nr:BsuPI-related putative proteinase inhibitor [Candidatus Bathyarchaeota archaeon]
MKTQISVKTQTSKSQYSVEEEVEISVTITNGGRSPVELIFTSAQRYDFIISKGEKEIWRWSNGKMFAMTIEQLILQPNETLTYTEKWKPTDATPGEYKATGVIMNQPPFEAPCTFIVDRS